MRIATISIEYDGDLFKTVLVIPPETHVLGLRPVYRRYHSPSNDHALLDDEDREQLFDNLEWVCQLLRTELRRLGDSNVKQVGSEPLF